jgi:cytochrome c-type biogenesis protein
MIAGFVIIVLGLHVAGVLKFRFLYYERRFKLNTTKGGFVKPFLVGLAFAFGWTPCVGPVLSAILVYSGSQETVWQGIWLLSMYSLGLGIPFFITGISINTFLSILKKIRKYYRAIEIIVGVSLIIMGILLITDSFTIITCYLTRWFPWLLKG